MTVNLTGYSRSTRAFFRVGEITYAAGDGFVAVGGSKDEIRLTNSTINSIQSWGGMTLIATDDGAYVLPPNGSDVAEHFEPLQGYRRQVTGFFVLSDNDLYAATQDGVFRIVDGEAKPPSRNVEVVAITSGQDGHVWAATESGLLQVDGEQFFVPAKNVTHLQSFDGVIWGTSSDGLIVCRNSQAFAVLTPYRANTIALVGGHLQIGCDTGLYDASFDAASNAPFQQQIIMRRLSKEPVLQLFPSDDKLIIIGDRAVYEWDRYAMFPITLVARDSIVRGFRQLLGYEILLTEAGAFRLVDHTAHLLTPRSLRCFDVAEFKGHLLFATSDGLYTMFEDAGFDVNIAPIRFSLSGWIADSLSLGSVSGDNHIEVHYYPQQLDDEIRKHSLDPHVEVSMPGQQNDRTLTSSRFTWKSVRSYNLALRAGRNRLHLWIRDRWGSTQVVSRSVWALPPLSWVSCFVSLFLVVVVVAAFASFEHSKISRRFLLSPFLSMKWLGVLWLTLSLFPRCRSYLLRLYLTRLIGEAASQQVEPKIENVAIMKWPIVARERILHLVLGRTFRTSDPYRLAMALISVGCLNSNERKNRAVPIVLHVTSTESNLEGLLKDALAQKSEIRDERLLKLFIEQGNFHLFIWTEIQRTGLSPQLPDLVPFITNHKESDRITILSGPRTFRQLEVKRCVIK